MKFAIFLLACVAAEYNQTCKCYKKEALPAFCEKNDKHFVGRVRMTGVGVEWPVANPTHILYTRVAVKRVYKGDPNYQSGDINILFAKECKVMLRDEITIGGVFKHGKNLTVTRCDYDTWVSRTDLDEWQEENQKVYEDYEDAKYYNNTCINIPEAIDRMEAPVNAKDLSGYCFDREEGQALENLRLYCSSHFVGRIRVREQQKLEEQFFVKVVKKEEEYKGTTDFTEFKQSQQDSTKSEYFPVWLPEHCKTTILRRRLLPVIGNVTSDKTILNVTDCSNMWYAVEEGEKSDLEFLCKDINGLLDKPYVNLWCSADFLGHIVESIYWRQYDRFQVTLSATYRESARFKEHREKKGGSIVVWTNDTDCKNRLNKKEEVAVRGTMEKLSSGDVLYVDCGTDWKVIDEDQVARLNASCKNGENGLVEY